MRCKTEVLWGHIILCRHVSHTALAYQRYVSMLLNLCISTDSMEAHYRQNKIYITMDETCFS